MIDDACFACGTPVESGHAYCSDECAFQDGGPDSNGLSETVIPSISSFMRTSPSKDQQQQHDHHHHHMTSTVVPNDGHILPFALQNPHPEFELPIAQYSSAYARRKKNVQRKRTSLSSSEASSEFSTPSAPPLTDDDDSMSDPEFVLEPQTDAPTPSRPTLSYARRSSATNTRSTVRPHIPTAVSSSTSTSGSSKAHSTASTHSQENRNRTPSRTRRSRDAITLLDDINKLLYSDERDRRRHTDSMRPQSFRLHRHSLYEEEVVEGGRREDLDASYATLTKFSVAAKPAETIRSPKSRRPPTGVRPRASLPAYFSLTKISRTSPGGFATWYGNASPSQDSGERVSRPLHKTSPTVAYSDMSSSTATLSASVRRSAVTVAQTVRTASNSRSSSQNSTRHTTTSVRSGTRSGSPSSRVSMEGKVRPSEKSRLSTRTSAVPPSDGDELAAQMASALRQASALDFLQNRIGVESGDTPRGRTRSRSNRPRSRSRSRTRERAQRAHFGGEPALRDMVATGLAMTSRGRPDTEGVVEPLFSRGRRERKQVDDEVAADVEIDWLDVTDEPEPVPERAMRRRALLLS